MESNNNNPKEAGALVIRNLSILLEADRLLSDIDYQLDDLVGRLISAALSGKNEWLVKVDEDWFTHKRWIEGPDEQEPLAWFEVWASSLKDDSEYYITQICRQGSGLIGVSWNFHEKRFSKNKRWKNGIGPKCTEILDLGFQYSTQQGFWLLPMRVDPGALADAYTSDSMEDVIGQEIERCLAIVEKSVSAFDQIVAEARS